MSAIACGYLTLPASGAQIHYRIAGEGPPLIMLHPSPQHSELLEPAILRFSEVCTCIAIDTPGYGLSDDPLPADATLKDYSDLVYSVADALGVDRFFLYGAATGAQIAIEMGKHQPERLALVLLDSNGHIDVSERERVMQGYFPQVTPRRDGGHLLTMWDMCSRLFSAFPWNSLRTEDRLPIPRLSADVIHTTLLRYFDAGDDYAKAYRLALEVEDIAHFAGFAAAAAMNRWEGSVVLNIADALIAKGLPDNVRVLHAGPSLEERYGVQLEALREAIAREGMGSVGDLPQRPAFGLHRTFLETPQGNLHAWRCTEGEGATLVMLHGAGGSSQDWHALCEKLAGQRPLLAIDLPGHGHSRVTADWGNVESLAAPVIAALGAAHEPAIEVIGTGLGAAVALAVQHAIPEAKVTLLDPLPPFAANEIEVPDLTPRDSGAHLAEAWHFVRERSTRFPFWQGAVPAQRAVPLDQSPAALHAQAADILRLGADFAALLSLELGLDWQARLAGTTGSVTIAATAAHPRPEFAESLAGADRALRPIKDLAQLLG